jgi:acyl-CoA synthetase (AMP-forming)/AMP-acid ligase II/acyl carrier protein
MRSDPWFLDKGIPTTLDWNLLWQKVSDRYRENHCIRLRNRWLSYTELAEEAERLKGLLHARSEWHAGALVLLPVKGEDFFAKLIAVWNASGVAVPARDVESGSPEHAIVTADFFWGDEHPVPIISGSDLPSSQWHAIYCTSGSTGRPRPIVRGWRQALYEAGHYCSVLGLREGMDCTMLIHPSFGASTKHFFGCLLSGCRQAVPSVTGSTIRGGDLLYGTPSQILSCASKLSSSQRFELISLTGEPFSPRVWEAIRSLASSRAKCLNALGGTETGVLINSLCDIGSKQDPVATLSGVGLQGKELSVVNENEEPLPAGTPGLLKVESEWIAEGYLDRNPEGIMVFHPFQKRGETRSFLTGDVVVEKEGCLHHLGRSGSMIKHRGEWIDTDPLRSVLSRQGINDIHLERGGEGNGLRVWIRLQNPDRETLRKIALEITIALGDSPLLPEFILAIGEFPINAHGKTNLRQLALLAESGEVLTERIPSRVERIAEAILRRDWDSSSLRGALRIGDLALDSLSLHELMVELERFLGCTISPWKMSPATPLAEICNSCHRPLRVFTRFSGEEGLPLLLWFGDGVIGIHQELRKRVRILHWDISAFPGANGLERVRSMRELALLLIAMAEPAELTGRIVVGGFSVGAVVAHEASLVLSERGIKPAGVVLLDPPDLDDRPIRCGWRWSRWRPSILCTLLSMLPTVVLDMRNGKLRCSLQGETMRLVRERRRALLRNYSACDTSIPTLLATSGWHHKGAIRFFGHLAMENGIMPLGVDEHLSVMTDAQARFLWMTRLKQFLFCP